MTNEQFKEIKDMAWDWWCKNMLDWAVNTIKDFDNAPEWVKNGVDNSLDPDNLQKLLRLSQSRNLEVNYAKELTELFEARRDNNEYGMIDALCDMVIIAMNAGAILGDEHSEWFYNNLINPIKYAKPYTLGLLYEIRQKGYDPYLCLLETIKELRTRTGAWNEAEGKWCKDLGAYTLNEAIEKADNCFKDIPAFISLKLLKEDEDFWLFGEWDVDDVSFFDDKTLDESYECLDGERVKVKKWYKADYENCKIAVCPYCKNNCGYGKYVECQNCGMKFQTIAD